LALVGLLFIVFPTILFPEDEAEFCKNFLLNNKAVNEHFGQIKSIKLVRGGGLSWSSSGERDGTCHFRVKGTMLKNVIKVRWEEKNKKMEITRVWMRQGLAGTQTFYPYQMGDVYILPSNIWDGIISWASAAICFLFYFGFKNRKKWATFFYFFVARNEKMRRFMQVIAILAGIWAIIEGFLCFLNIKTLF
jgi:hypothetical protein